MLNKARELLPDHNLKHILWDPKQKRFCTWRAAESDGWSQPAWDMCDRDHTKTCGASALELSQAPLGAGRQYSRSAFRSIWTVHCFPFHFQDEISAQRPVRSLHWIWQRFMRVTASQRNRKISWSQNKKIKPHFKYLFSFWRSLHWLVLSFKLGKF